MTRQKKSQQFGEKLVRHSNAIYGLVSRRETEKLTFTRGRRGTSKCTGTPLHLKSAVGNRLIIRHLTVKNTRGRVGLVGGDGGGKGCKYGEFAQRGGIPVTRPSFEKEMNWSIQVQTYGSRGKKWKDK